MNRKRIVITTMTAAATALLVGLAPRGAAGRAEANTCPAGLPGSEMVFIPAPSPFCIDAREVRLGEYAKFAAAAKEAPPDQVPQCKGNARFEPTFERPLGDELPPPDWCPPAAYDPKGSPEQAVRCVDWCDAHAYCAWAGKRLCGGMGSRGGLVEGTTEFDPNATEWQFACTSGGQSKYPYGDDLEPGRCVDRTASVEARLAGAGSKACVGATEPFSHVADLGGNVSEWTAECNSEFTRCVVAGGRGGPDDSCAQSTSQSIPARVQMDRGIRCCADPVVAP